MTSEKIARFILVISLGLAAIIVISSFFLPSNNEMQAVTFLLLTAWLIPFSYLLRLKRKSSAQAPNDKEGK